MLNLDVIYHIALWTNFKRTIAIIGSCKSLWSTRKQLYIEKQLLNNTEVIDHWTPEQNYYNSTKQFMMFTIKYHEEVKFYELSNGLKNYLKNNHIITAKLTKRFVCLWGQYVLKYYNTLEEIKCEKLFIKNKVISGCFVDLKNSIPCYNKWKNEYYEKCG